MMAACLGSMFNQNQPQPSSQITNNIPLINPQPVQNNIPAFPKSTNQVSNNFLSFLNFHQLINIGPNKLNNKRVKKINSKKRRNIVNSVTPLNTTNLNSAK
jgi:hypothetical protein